MWKRWQRYEFWPFWIFYLPFIPVWIVYAIKARSFTYFCNANPGIEWGGFTSYSKSKILEFVPRIYLPSAFQLKNEQAKPPLPYPFVAKPDFGERGKQVELINNRGEWNSYLQQYNWNIPLLVQDYMQEKEEYALFYVRLPNEKKGKVLSITTKEFLKVTGDGVSTLAELVSRNMRVAHRISYLKSKFKNDWLQVLEKNQEFLVEEIGNHNRGTIFRDGTALITIELEKKIDEIAQGISGFYYGRFDVKAGSDSALQKGEFRIIEINGANSEATHIYDPKHNLLFAYKEVFRHLNWQFRIAMQNHKNGYPWHSHRALFKVLFRQLFGTR